MTLSRIVVASNNPGKLNEFQQLLSPLGLTFVPQGQLNVPEAEEPHCTFVENALAKARHASRITGLPALADDSGLCVEALMGAPGVLSARFAGEPKNDARNNQKLLDELAGKQDRRAHFYCVLVLVRHADDPQPLIAEGEWHGEIVAEAAGEAGFGYDPLFWVPQQACTSAQLDATLKNRLSHRGQAMMVLQRRLQQCGVL
jgi:XTP/dITP diphosphohydrolase